jgi:hypothetical protein
VDAGGFTAFYVILSRVDKRIPFEVDSVISGGESQNRARDVARCYAYVKAATDKPEQRYDSQKENWGEQYECIDHTTSLR